MKRSDDILEQADQKASMEMLGRRTVCKAHTIFRSARKLDGPTLANHLLGCAHQRIVGDGPQTARKKEKTEVEKSIDRPNN